MIFLNVNNAKKNGSGSNEDQADNGTNFWKELPFLFHILLPIAGITLLWRQREFISKILLQLDKSCIAVYCPSLSKREKLLKWASDRLPSTWSSQARTLSGGIPELWKDGALLCTLINSVVPGACPNPHRHWRKPPLHAQALAYKYLGVVPMFTDFELSGDFVSTQEKKFIQYLRKLQEAINVWSSTDEVINRKFSSQYVARGMGLYTGEQGRKATFYIYCNSTQIKTRSVLMYIRGPFGTQGKAVISFYNTFKSIPLVKVSQTQLQAAKIAPVKDTDNFFLKAVSLNRIIGGPDDKEDRNNIPIQIDMEIDRVKVTYIPDNTGIYEINLIYDGELLRGSPYIVQVNNNSSGTKDSLSVSTESDSIEEKVTFTKRKILSSVIDCVYDKISIDKDEVLKLQNKSSIESVDSDELTITAITKKDSEIFRTEFNCNIEDIAEGQEAEVEIPDVSVNQEVDEVDSKDFHKIIEDKPSRIDLPTEETNPLINLEEVPKEEITPTINLIGPPIEEEKPPINLDTHPSKTYFGFPENTSPICPDHIAPEVEKSNLNQLSLSEKRRIFLKQDSVSIPDYDITFSISENNSMSTSSDLVFRELSVLNVLDSLKQSSNEMNYLSTSVSVPNMASIDFIGESINENTFKARKDYWERMSSHSSSNISLASEEYNHKKEVLMRENLLNRLNAIERQITQDHTCLISKNTDRSLEDCSLIPIDERKKELLKKMQALEKPQTLKVKPVHQNVTNEKIPAKPIRIPDIEKRTLPQPLDSPKEVNNNVEEKSSVKNSMKSSFNKAVHFFKNLEKNVKLGEVKNHNIMRSFSLDYQQKKRYRKPRRSSLNLSHVSTRFSIDNLYKDVNGNENSSFKGAPNRRGIVKSLASIWTKMDSGVAKTEDENISYNLFEQKVVNEKSKRKKLLFDIHY